MAAIGPSSSPFHKRHNFSETDPRVRIELRKADLLLKKEMERLEKQTKASTNIISDHQQALKMSWRRLEMQRRQDESPTVNRRTRRTSSLINDSRRRLLFANATSVSMDTPTPSSSLYDPTTTTSNSNSRLPTRGGHRVSFEDELSSTGSVPLLPPIDQESLTRPNTRGYKTSPYISSPHAFRRQAPKMLPHLNGGSSHPLSSSTASTATGGTTTATKPRSDSTGSSTDDLPQDDDNTITIPASSKTVDKKVLMKAKELLNFKDYDPKSFQQFYSTTDVQGGDSLGASRIFLDELHQINTDPENMSEEEMMKQLTLEEQQKLKKAKEEGSESTLAKMFEQIKNCRYIRHYHPKGSTEEEEEEEGKEEEEERREEPNFTVQNTMLPLKSRSPMK